MEITGKSIEDTISRLDLIFTHKELAKERSEAFKDETGETLLAYIFPELLDETVSEDEITDYMSTVLSSLKLTVILAYNQVPEEGRERLILEEVRSLLEDDDELKKSFTAGEAIIFIKAINDAKMSEVLNMLDQITGVYLSLKALNRILEKTLNS